MNKKEAENIFYEAKKLFRTSRLENYQKSKELYDQIKDISKYRKEAYNDLFLLAITNNKFNAARYYLEELKKYIPEKYYSLKGKLEFEEYNYNEALECYKNQVFSMKENNYAKIGVASCYIQLGEFTKARKILMHLLDDKNIYIEVMKNLICIDISERKYDDAINKINVLLGRVSDSKKRKKIIGIKQLLEIKMGKNPVIITEDYYDKRLANLENKNVLYQEIEKHKASNDIINFPFINEIDSKKLVNELEEKMKVLYPNISYNNDCYTLRTTTTTGIKGENAIRFSAFPDTPYIINAYPVTVSREFNNEGNIADEVLITSKIKK